MRDHEPCSLHRCLSAHYGLTERSHECRRKRSTSLHAYIHYYFHGRGMVHGWAGERDASSACHSNRDAPRRSVSPHCPEYVPRPGGAGTPSGLQRPDGSTEHAAYGLYGNPFQEERTGITKMMMFNRNGNLDHERDPERRCKIADLLPEKLA